ncbi:uncharacterized protein F4812DRAFT_415160 [Daldinia caldariorum]|uniref:uncharacterized protein n=1 Tax=Daldinia caldariorum TaxID=326644 RepID=UPI0020083342|nr:uncharacterized protein F4812DRAFT_415160 [Daldinia caldariorum]KAI1471703.1 hypothetical protein F4812DRAFT_415160 [Daldinia caldariorum]
MQVCSFFLYIVPSFLLLSSYKLTSYLGLDRWEVVIYRLGDVELISFVCRPRPRLPGSQANCDVNYLACFKVKRKKTSVKRKEEKKDRQVPRWGYCQFFIFFCFFHYPCFLD